MHASHSVSDELALASIAAASPGEADIAPWAPLVTIPAIALMSAALWVLIYRLGCGVAAVLS